MPVDPAVTRKFIENLSTTLEDHLASWKSAMADTRTDIVNLLTAMGDRIPAQAKPLFPEDIVAMLLEDVVPPPPPPERIVERVVEKVVETVNVPVPGPATSDWTLVKGSLSAIEAARTQVDVLTRFLAESLVHASRVALLVLRNDRVSGWKALGFDATGGRDDAIKGVDFAVADDPFVQAVIKGERSMIALPPADGSPLRRALGGRPPARTLLVPMVIRDRLSGILCADELPDEEGRLNESALEVLTFVTGLAVDLLAARKKIPSPALTPRGEAISVFHATEPEPPAPAEPAWTEEPAPQPELEREPAPAPAPEPPRPVQAAIPSPPPLPPQPAPRLEEPRPVAPPPSPDFSLGTVPPPSRSLLEPADFLSRTKRRITDAGEALRALEESATAKKKSEAAIPMPPDLLSSVSRTSGGITPPPVPRHPTAEIPAVPLPRPIQPPVAAPVSQAPPPPVQPPPAQPSAAVRGDLTLAFESLKSTIPPGPPAAFGEPPAALPLPRPAPAPAPAPPVAPAPPAVPSSAATIAVPSVSPMETGSGFASPLAPPAGFVPRGRLRPDDPQRAFEDARRLARLLVSEIKLYNERKVLEGRAAGDLYERLKDDIERSRQLYTERTPESVRRDTSFFNDELVRILADGKHDAMGPMP